MKRALIALAAAVVLVGIGLVVWFYASTGLDESVTVTAPPLVVGTEATVGSTAADEPTSSSAATGAPAEPAGTGTTTPTDAAVFELADESTVTFELDEDLRGQPTRVVATNDEVAGQFRFDPADPAATEIGTIVIAAQSFVTDQRNRDRAIRGPILDAAAVPTIEFTPTEVEGLEGQVEVGETVEFTVTGDLTIREVTNPVTFEAAATLAAADRVEGSAIATVLRSDFDLQIPSVASVANVSDEVLIRLDFVGEPAG